MVSDSIVRGAQTEPDEAIPGQRRQGWEKNSWSSMMPGGRFNKKKRKKKDTAPFAIEYFLVIFQSQATERCRKSLMSFALVRDSQFATVVRFSKGWAPICVYQ